MKFTRFAKPNTTLILDGNNLLHRVHWIANQKSSEGFLHIHLFFTSVKKFIQLYQPNNIICCWDKRLQSRVNFRQQVEEYKANRDREYCAEVLKDIDSITAMLESIGCKNFFPNVLEADDCIAYICEKNEGRSVIVSVDHDLLQLVQEDPLVVFYNPSKSVEINTQNYKEYTDYDNSKQFLIAKCLQGDKSDNITGLKGFGPVKIQKYISGLVSLDSEQLLLFERNKQLMTLKHAYTREEGEEHVYERQLESPFPLANITQFEQFCDQFGLNSLKKDTFWYYTFGLSQKFREIFA